MLRTIRNYIQEHLEQEPLGMIIEKATDVDKINTVTKNKREQNNIDKKIVSFPSITIAVEAFIKLLGNFSITTFQINEMEMVIIVEDSVIYYLGLHEHAPNPSLYMSAYRFLHIEELSYDTLGIKFYRKSFILVLRKIMGFDSLDNVYYEKFRGYNGGRQRFNEETLIERVERLVPDVKLKERYDAWAGIPYYFIIMAFESIKGNIDYAVAFTTQKPHNYITSKCKEWIKKGFKTSDSIIIRRNVYLSNANDAFNSWKGKSRQYRLENHFYYYFVEEYVKEGGYDYAKILLEKAYSQKFEGQEKSTYLRSINKWKTEELVYKLTKKLYKEYKVIYQHRPSFLRSKIGGQMSYDVFIVGLNIAIEYQGKQHFEPVQFFGGHDSFEKVKERDAEKLRLSQEYGITLIYFDYTEIINEALIKEKLESARNSKGYV